MDYLWLFLFCLFCTGAPVLAALIVVGFDTRDDQDDLTPEEWMYVNAIRDQPK